MQTFEDWAADPATAAAPTPTHILGLGMGVDSVAILLRWIEEPTSRPFATWDDLVVVTAQTGDEHDKTGRDIEGHVYPRLAALGVRTIQAARGQRHVTTAGGGVVILADTRTPDRCYIEGVYKLSTEMLEAGTVPQTGGARLCSVHSKGDALDPVIEHLTRGQAFVHVVGFEVNEQSRIRKDRGYNTDVRTGLYPLDDWAWDRARCEEFILAVTGVHWRKSACTFCPFAMSNKASRARQFDGWASEPAAGVAALMLEHTSRALNPSQTLVGKDAAADLVAAHPAAAAAVLPAFRAALEDAPHAVYEVRRILRASKGDPTKRGNGERSVRLLATGSRTDMLADLAGMGDTLTGRDGITRVWVRNRGASYPTVEHLYVVAPATALDKEKPQFDGWWATATGTDDVAVAAEPDAPAAPAPLTLFDGCGA